MPDPTTSLLATFTLINACAFAAFGLDKSRAKRGAQRISERRLIELALLGGWPAALLAMAVFRHKTSKISFQLKLALAITANLGLCFAAWHFSRS